MPLREDGKKTGCWTNRSRLEQILIGVLLIAILIAVVLMFFVIRKQSHAKPVELSSDTCHTSTCINEAAKIIQRIDPNANPCEDFYQFACGNFLKASHGDGKLNRFYQMRDQRKRELLEMYAEDTRGDDHKIVKSAKNLFKGCMNETEIERDNLSSIKKALEEIGGWPVLRKGLNWKEANFDWLNATYKLRELGYPFSVFLGLDIQEDMDSMGKYIFKVQAPNLGNGLLDQYSKEHAVEIMTEIAMVFGAEDRQFAFKQMDGTYRFWKYLQSYGLYRDQSRTTISDFQQKYGNAFNWLEFINNITGPAVQTTMNEYVLFQNAEGLRSWLDLMTTTPKRTLANYMIWKVIEEQLPYLTRNIRNLDTKREDRTENPNETLLKSRDESRAEFCLSETQKRFTSIPIEIMINRKYLPAEKRKQVEEILLNIKSEFVNLLKNADWMEKGDNRIAVAKAEAVTVAVGQVGNYFDDKMLDALDLDMVETKSDTFLNLLAQANRNYQTRLYNQIKMATSENWLNRPHIKNMGDFSVYDEDNNVIFVPAIATQGFAFHENRPNYLNYGSLGNAFGVSPSLLANTFDFEGKNTEKWSNKTRQAAEKLGPCLRKNMNECQLSEVMLKLPFAMDLGLGERISYAAYEMWAKINGEEQKLIGVDYTPRQLFWISATNCYATNIYSSTNEVFSNDPMFFQRITCGARSNNLDFAKDFDCPAGSRMNPATKCNL